MSFRRRNKEKPAHKRQKKDADKPRQEGREGQARMSSISRSLHGSWIKKKLIRLGLMDILLFIGMFAAWLIGQETAAMGGFAQGRHLLKGTGSLQTLCLVVTAKDGTESLRISCWPAIGIILGFVCGLIAFQLVLEIISLVKEDAEIRTILAPINEIALKADELSRLSFSEDKYHVIEDAIANIQPGEETPLAFGDSDLSGIEAAMNNLLLRMRDTYRQQARFVNDASHELRTPISVIMGYANMLDRWGKTDEKVLEESIQAIKNETAHMNHLVEQLLFLARGDSGRTQLQKEEVSLNHLCQEIYEESLLIDEKHAYRIRNNPEEIIILADGGLLKQAVRILVDNAAKYTPDGRDILLGCGLAGNEAFIQVQDAGIGMSEEDVAHMFERFYRSDEVRSYAGTGLGLSIAKWIIDRHKGHIEVLSRTGLGTRIRVKLPREER